MTTNEPKQPLSLPRDRTLPFKKMPLVMGIVNITPDSFSDGGRHLAPEAAVERALELLDEGADLLDLGAESSRPGGGVYGSGAEAVSATIELERLRPVLERIRTETNAPISIDTRKARVAEAALAAGADLINDVTALGDPEMAAVVAEAGCPLILMHSRGELRSMQREIDFVDVVAEVRDELDEAFGRALEAGIGRHQVILDPGIGFGKTCQQNLTLIRRLPELHSQDTPVLLGSSRKSFIGDLAGVPVDQRLAGSLASVAWASLLGADVVRVHDVAATCQFLRVFGAIALTSSEAA